MCIYTAKYVSVIKKKPVCGNLKEKLSTHFLFVKRSSLIVFLS
jgi:hypothetical protein